MDTEKKNGILKATKQEKSAQRSDKFKNIIQKGSKKHRIAFIDEVDKQQSLAQVHEVENWRIYNMEEPPQETKQSCGCVLF